MTNKTMIIAGAVAGLFLVAAVLTTQQDDAVGPQIAAADNVGEPLLPALRDRAEDAATITIKTAEETLTLERQDDTWTLAEKSNYPVRFDRVRELIVSLGQMEKLEPKTKVADNYARIGVEDIDTEEAASKLVEVKDSAGETLASILIGNSAWAGSDARQFVRVPGQEQSWLVSGSANVITNQNSWLDTTTVDIQPTRAARVTIEHPDGETIAASRTSEEEAHLKLESIPEGREPHSDSRVHQLASAFRGMRFDEVQRLETVDLAGLEATVATLETFDGLQVRAELYEVGEKTMGVLYAEALEEKIEEINEARRAEAKAAEETEAESSEETGETESEAPAEPDLIDIAAIVEEAEKINNDFGVWAYEFPSFITDRLSRRTEYFLKELPAETAEEEASMPEDEGPSLSAAEPPLGTDDVPSTAAARQPQQSGASS